jgi:hypothetical protein
MPQLRALALLLIATALTIIVAGSAWVGVALVPFFAALIAAEIDRGSGEMATAIVRVAARALPRAKRAELREEWIDHVQTAGERGVLPLTRAASILFIAAPTLAIGLRVGAPSAQAHANSITAPPPGR